jgi:dynein heavy chain
MGHHERRLSVGSVAASEGSHGDKKKPDFECEATNYTTTSNAKNYYKNVSEDKEVAKFVSLLSTSINSMKKVNSELYLI